MSIIDLPEELFFIESIEMEGCVFKGKEKKLETISKQIWEGSHSIFSFLFGNKQCVGIKDIVNEWIGYGTKTILFYIPKSTLQKIREHLIEDRGTHLVASEIENYILSKIHKNLPSRLVYSLSNERDINRLSTIFDIESLKKELERTNTSNTHQIYLIGLPFKPQGEDIDFYLNGEPIAYQGGMLLGSSKIFAQRIPKGTILVTSDDGIRVNFFDTHNYESSNENINFDLKSLDFKRDSIHFELYKKRPTIMESKSNHQLFFSRLNSTYKAYQKEAKEIKSSTAVAEERRQGAIGVNLESYYVPFTKELTKLYLLLIRQNGKNRLVGGEYHPKIGVDVVAQITIDIENLKLKITNYAKENLVFEKYTNDLWRLTTKEEKNNQISSENIYTNILNDNEQIETSLAIDIPTLNSSKNDTLTIKPKQSAYLETQEIEFNDSNLYRDNSGVWVRYSEHEIERFDKHLELNRNVYKFFEKGAILDAYVEYDAEKKTFLYGAKVQNSFTDILSRAISSRPIVLTYEEDELKIENRLDATYYMVQVLSSSQKYVIDENEKAIMLKLQDIPNLKIDIINKIHRSRPLIRFGLTLEG